MSLRNFPVTVIQPNTNNDNDDNGTQVTQIMNCHHTEPSYKMMKKIEMQKNIFGTN